jgi:hypothetical protein
LSTHPGMLLAYNAAGDVVATLDYMVRYDDTPERKPLGLIDFAAHEEAAGELTAIWTVDSGNPAAPVRGSKVWPEWLGGRAQDFRVELDGPPGRKRISALVHKTSGYRRERAAVEDAIASRIAAAAGAPADIRDLVGGPDRPLALDDDGRPAVRAPIVRPNLPVVAVVPPAASREGRPDGSSPRP